MGSETRWLTYEDMGLALGITSESAKRLAMRHKWPRRPGNDGRALVAVPEERLEEAAQAVASGSIRDGADDDTPVAAGDVTDDGRSDARALIGYLERRVEELTDDLADTRNELRAARFEADTLRAQAGRADVLVALVEVERTRTAEVRTEMTARIDLGRALLEGVQAERDRLLVEVRDRRQSWVGRLVGQLRG
ncbi:hypothetical protein D3273_27085 [Lichenibacterium minor]|uniref:DNA-binding protein n=1 Tax=Lichenibacterium minor TaxID=2316528 RepID=A0A4Q2TZR4_9HYPH|nr:hypothetical protein [Lichenibacterium minor]RYC28848.1 hypothetical protein D3273_27085 [Lichenibacterium minor]